MPQETTLHHCVTIAGNGKGALYALREDGAVFVLIKRGDMIGHEIADEPYWAVCPSVPGTLADFEARAEAGPNAPRRS